MKASQNLLGILTVAGLALSINANAAFDQGFETDTSGWNDYAGGTITRVSSGTGGIMSFAGNYHAQVTGGSAGPYTTWGGYNTAPVPFVTSLAIYLDVGNTHYNAASGTTFNLSSAVSTPSGDHRRDFIFTGGYYNDLGAGSDQQGFVIRASNNSPGMLRNSDGTLTAGTFTISSSGWYIFETSFYEVSGGVLAVDLSILDSSSNTLNTWTLSNPYDIVGTTVGGNRYGWFATEGFNSLAIDSSMLVAPVPEPSTYIAGALLLLPFAVSTVRRFRNNRQA